jgi:uncharacterized membrane protein
MVTAMEAPAAPRASRAELDALVEHHRLGPSAVEALLALAGARPTPGENLQFARRLLGLGGVLSLLAAVVFFVAANWEALGRLARFGLVALLLVASAGLAAWRPPPARTGRLGLLAAFVLSGVLLALFGQTYQTGADVHELFFGWAALGLPLAVAGSWAVTWAAWLLVLDVAFALLCGWLPGQHVLWLLLGAAGLSGPLLHLLPLAVGLAAWWAIEVAGETRLREAVAPWLGRFALAGAFGFATWGAVLVILPFHHWDERGGGGWILVAAGAVAAVLVALRTLKRQRDVFPLAVVAGTVVALGTALLLRGLEHSDEAGTFFAVTAWLVGSSAATSWVLMGLHRQWRKEGTLA